MNGPRTARLHSGHDAPFGALLGHYNARKLACLTLRSRAAAPV
ncbi:hypothetical protein [Breoghania sp. JC706]